MANKQETLIYIEKENHTEAEFMSRNFVNKELKARAYLNAIGAELVTKYLASEGIKTNNIHNLHSISKVLESVDISDILLPNIHLDVRVVFDENEIFIPKSHFELELTPDAYVVLKLEKEFKHVELLGYFKPSQINKQNANKEYYFFDKNKLSSPESLTKFVKDFTGRTSRDISEEDLLRGRELAIALADHNISVSEEKELLELLLLSDVLRESVLEFDNFETLSYSTATVLSEITATPAVIEAEVVESSEETQIEEEPLAEISEEIAPVEEISLATMAMDEALDLDATFSEEDLIETPLEDPVSDEEETEDEEDDAEEAEEEEIIEDDDIADKLAEENLEENLDIDETLEEVAELDFQDLEPVIEEEVIEEEITEEEEILEEEAVIEESSEEIVEDIIDEELVDIQEELDIEEPTEDLISEEEEIIEEPIEEVVEDIVEEDTIETSEEIEELEIEEEVELNIEENLIEEPIEQLEETVEEVEETIEPTENVQEEIENTTEESADIEENLPTLDIDETPALEIDPTDLGDDLLGGNLVDENNEIITTEEEKTPTEEVVEEEALEIEEPPLTPDEPYVPQVMGELSVDSILDQTIASISTPKSAEELLEEAMENDEDEMVKQDTKPEIEPLDVAAAATATALAGAVAKAAEEAETVSEEAIKLASVAGEMINDVVQNLEEGQQKNLDKIDYEKTDITAEIDAPEHLIAATEDLSLAKMEASIEAELSGEFGGPTDLENLNEVEIYEEEEFIQDSIDFGSMETVSREELLIQGNESLDLDNLSDINIDMSAGANNLPDVNLNTTEEGVVDLPQFSSGGFAISEDGTSPMDSMLDMSIDMENKEEEGLMDMDLNGETSPLGENELDFSSCIKPSTRKREEHSSDKQKPTIDEETRQALLANNIVRSADDDDDSFVTEDFGETIVIDDDEPFVIDTEETVSNDTELAADEADISELFGDDISTEETKEEILTEDSINELLDTPATEETSDGETLDELALDNIETMNEIATEEIKTPEDVVFETSEENSQEEQLENLQDMVELAPEQQDWLEDTNYENLEDVEIQPQESIEDFIAEPSAEEKTYAVKENSTVISDRTFKTGEIHIDINAQHNSGFEEDESLASIYNPNSRVPGGALLQTPGTMNNVNPHDRRATGLLGLLGTLIVLALVGAIGFGVAQLFKAPKEEAPQPITDGPLPSSTDNGVTDANTLKINPNNVVNMENNSNTLATTNNQTQKQVKQQTPANVSASTTQKKGPAKSFVSIQKLTWSLPSYVSSNPQFKQYFQSAGKSLKLSLTSDLLLATDYLYSDNMRIGVTFAKDGSLQDTQIITSSGSNQIDKIVLQTVNQILTSLKAPNSVGNEENTPVTLNIYF